MTVRPEVQAAIAAEVRRRLAEAPPLTERQKEFLGGLIRGTVRPARDDAGERTYD